MAESLVQNANFVVAYDPTVISAVQDKTLVRVFRDALFPRLLFRGEAVPELWAVNLGANQTFTRTGLMRPTTRPLKQGNDPIAMTYANEQWFATAIQYGSSIETNMLTNYVTLASLYLRNMHQLGLHAGQSLNRNVRDKLYNAYTGGNTVVAANQAASTFVPVVSLNGFTQKLLNGRPSPVSPSNPLPITIISNGIPFSANVVGFTSNHGGDEIHDGVLTLDVAHSGVSTRDIVLAGNRAQVINAGAGQTIDDITSSDQFALADVRAAHAQLRFNNIPTHEDGTFHWHLDPTSESQIFGDNEFQRLNQSLPDYLHYREMAIGHMLGSTFYRNTECPVNATVDQDPDFGFTYAPEIFNTPVSGAPVEIHRPIVTGGGCIEEKYLDESKLLTAAGYLGKVGEFAVSNNGMAVMTERIRLILRSPIDKMQQVASESWSFSGDWPIPTDAGSKTSPADFKRAVCVQHGA